MHAERSGAESEVLPRRTAARGGPRSPAASGRGARAGPCSAREVLCARPSQKHRAVMAAWGRRAHRTGSAQCVDAGPDMPTPRSQASYSARARAAAVGAAARRGAPAAPPSIPPLGASWEWDVGSVPGRYDLLPAPAAGSALRECFGRSARSQGRPPDSLGLNGGPPPMPACSLRAALAGAHAAAAAVAALRARVRQAGVCSNARAMGMYPIPTLRRRRARWTRTARRSCRTRWTGSCASTLCSSSRTGCPPS